MLTTGTGWGSDHDSLSAKMSLLPGWWRRRRGWWSEWVRALTDEAHHGLGGWGELLSHERLGPRAALGRWGRGLAEGALRQTRWLLPTAPSSTATTGLGAAAPPGAILATPARAVTLVLVAVATAAVPAAVPVR